MLVLNFKNKLKKKKMKLKNYYSTKIVVVTGAASGIGRAIAEILKTFSTKKIIVIDKNINELEKIEGDNIEKYCVDVSNEKMLTDTFEQIIYKNGSIDLLINNAGIACGGEFQNFSYDLWNKVLNTNLWGVIYSTTIVYKQMMKQKEGQIVNVASLGGLIPEPMAIPYSVSKHAIVGLSNSLRSESKDINIKVNVVCPGVIKTSIFDSAMYVGQIDKEKLKTATLDHGTIDTVLCAKRILKGISKNKPIILIKTFDKIFWNIYRFSPSLLISLNIFIARYFRNNFVIK